MLLSNRPLRSHAVVAERGFDVRCSDRDDPQWIRCERELEEQGVPIPLVHRLAWVEVVGTPSRLLSAHDATGRCLAAFAVALTRTRAAPGHVIVRAERVGPSADLAALRAALEGWARMFTAMPRVLRLEVAVQSFDPTVRAELGAQLARDGFHRLGEPRAYERTAVLDLRPSEDELFESLHRTARRHIRAAGKRGARLQAIRSQDHRDAMQALVVETRRRTHGRLPTHSVDELLTMAQSWPNLLHIVGLFSQDGGHLLSFAAGHHHGDHVTYGEAASTRDTAYRFPLGYAPLWELIRWAKRRGAITFDLGGITTGSHADADDELGGISDFKRYFRGRECTVGEEWSIEPHALRGAVANRITQVAEWARDRWRRSVLH